MCFIGVRKALAIRCDVVMPMGVNMSTTVQQITVHVHKSCAAHPPRVTHDFRVAGEGNTRITSFYRTSQSV